MLDMLRPANEIFKPAKVVCYGVQGIGKTSFAATFPKPVLLPIEDGASAIDVMSFPQITNYEALVEAIGALYAGEHDYKTAIIDTLDWLEPIIWEKTCRENNQPSIESFGYGKGYIEADKYWREIMGGLDALRLQRGMHIVMLAHSEVKRFESPETEAYDLYQMKLNKRSFALWQEWADMVLFLKYRVTIKHEKKAFGKKDDARSLGAGSGERIICTSERPAYHAKSRWALPDEIMIGKDATYGAFHEALTAATNGKYVRG